jgi:LysR family transcriptional regulator (chromosome initiation inhibitor)
VTMRIDYKHLAALDAVIREQSFDKAARSLHISQSAVSQRIAQLELQLGQRVLTRSLPMILTVPGERLLCHARQVAMLESELERTLSEDAEGYIVLSVAVSNDTLAWFVRTCMSWMPTEPRTLLHVYMDDESRTQAMMRNGSVLGCISQNPSALPGSEVTSLGAMRFYCVATPEFAQRHFPTGLTDTALEHAPAVMVCHDDPLHFQFLGLSNPGFEALFPFHLIPSINEFVDVICSGSGFGLVSGLLIGDRLEQGTLIDLTPEIDFRLPLYWHRWAMESPLISRLTCALVAQAQRLLDGNHSTSDGECHD